MDFEYVLVLEPNSESALAVGVTQETDVIVVGKVLCSTSSELVGGTVAFHKKTAINKIWLDDAEVLEYIPEWWKDELNKPDSRYETRPK